jgi:hypothetical protein
VPRIGFYAPDMSEQVASARWRVAVRLGVAALVWSLGLVVAAVALPVESSTSVSVNGITLTHSTLVQENGVRALVLAAIPLLASLAVAAAMVYRRRRSAPWSRPLAWGAIGLLALEALVGILTIGAFIVPVVILLILAVRLVPTAP